MLTFKNMLLGLASDPIMAVSNRHGGSNPIYKVTIDENKPSVRVEGGTGRQGDVIMVQNGESVESCCERLVKLIFLRGAMTLNATHSGPFQHISHLSK